MKKTILLLFTVLIVNQLDAQIYIANECVISFFLPTPIEDIAATNNKTIPFLNTKTGDLQMKLSMTAFTFEKPLMQEHFNENYVESEKFPYAIFKGKVNEELDYSKVGIHNVSVTGKLTIHGVEQERTIKGTIKVDKDKITASSKFMVVFEDHEVKIPALYSAVFPKETEVKFDATFVPFKKN